MLEMDVCIKFSCRNKELQHKLRDIFDLSCQHNRKDYLGLGELDNDTRWTEFYQRIERIAELDQGCSLIDSYITTLKSMSSKKGFVKLRYETGVYGKEFAQEMTNLLKNLGADEIKTIVAEPTSDADDELATAAGGC